MDRVAGTERPEAVNVVSPDGKECKEWTEGVNVVSGRRPRSAVGTREEP